MKQNYCYNIIKFLGALIIASLHYNWKICPQGYLIADFFFILTGFLIYKGKEKYYNKSDFQIISSKLKSIYFYYIFLIILDLIYRIIIGNIPNVVSFISSFIRLLLFIPYIYTGGGYTMFGLVWYLPTWLFCSVLLILFLKKQSQYESIIIGIICIVIMGKLYLLTDNHILNITVEKTISFFSFGFLRGMLEIGIGCITAKFSNNIKIYNQIFGHIILFFLFLLFLLIIFYRKPTPDFDFIFLPLVSLLLIILDNKKLMFVDWLDSFGEYHKKLLDLSLPIYIFHQPVIMLFDKLNIQHRVRYLPIYLLMVCVFAFLGNQLNIILQTFLMNKKSCCNNL